MVCNVIVLQKEGAPRLEPLSIKLNKMRLMPIWRTVLKHFNPLAETKYIANMQYKQFQNDILQ